MLKYDKVAIVIPVFNEGKSITNSLDIIKTQINHYLPNAGLIVVDDGSNDDSLERIKNVIGSAKSSFVVETPINQGYGAALLSGALKAKSLAFEFVIFMDSDNTNPVSEIPIMLGLLEKCDLVKASRFVSGSDHSEVPFKRRLFSIAGNRVLSFLFASEVKDITNGFRGWKLDSYLEIPSISRRFSSIVEEFYYAKVKEMRIVETPSILTSRDKEQRLTSANYSFKSLWAYFKPGLKFLIFHRFTKRINNLSRLLRN